KVIRLGPGDYGMRRMLWLCFMAGLLTALAACGGKARAQTDPPLIQPTPDPTMDAVVRGLVTFVIPTPTGPAGRTTSQAATPSQAPIQSTAAPARPAAATTIFATAQPRI